MTIAEPHLAKTENTLTSPDFGQSGIQKPFPEQVALNDYAAASIGPALKAVTYSCEGIRMSFDDYFEYRNVDPRDYQGFQLPAYLRRILSERPMPRVLDFGCGFGQLSMYLKTNNLAHVTGLDVSPPAIEHCRSQGLVCYDGRDDDFFSSHTNQYDFVIMSHVIEHLPKTEIIPLLKKVKALISDGGGAIVMVPNAQSNTGAYWAYEDFTHNTLFTSGSLYYVLRAAGFPQIEFLDPKGLEGLSPIKRIIKASLLKLYEFNYKFWNKITSSSHHEHSPMIFGYEVRALARVRPNK